MNKEEKVIRLTMFVVLYLGLLVAPSEITFGEENSDALQIAQGGELKGGTARPRETLELGPGLCAKACRLCYQRIRIPSGTPDGRMGPAPFPPEGPIEPPPLTDPPVNWCSICDRCEEQPQ
jgi:hypothetical protein